MKSILISIQPKWCELIASGKKTVEVRKTRPKIETPFKCYIYETKGKQVEHCDGCDVTFCGRGKVIGEFICDEIEEVPENIFTPTFTRILAESRLTDQEMLAYKNEKTVCGWRIYAVKIYNKPKKLSEFRKYSEWLDIPITRPPQSWCYVESGVQCE